MLTTHSKRYHTTRVAACHVWLFYIAAGQIFIFWPLLGLQCQIRLSKITSKFWAKCAASYKAVRLTCATRPSFWRPHIMLFRLFTLFAFWVKSYKIVLLVFLLQMLPLSSAVNVTRASRTATYCPPRCAQLIFILLNALLIMLFFLFLPSFQFILLVYIYIFRSSW